MCYGDLCIFYWILMTPVVLSLFSRLWSNIVLNIIKYIFILFMAPSIKWYSQQASERDRTARRSIKENCSPPPVAIFQFPEGEGRAANCLQAKVHNKAENARLYHPSNPKFGQISVICLIKPQTYHVCLIMLYILKTGRLNYPRFKTWVN
jgi:hypothetical protein